MFTSFDDEQRFDFRLLQNGTISLFLKPEVLADAKRELAQLEYEIREISCVRDRQFVVEMSRALRWKELTGNECWSGNYYELADVLEAHSLESADRTALILSGFHHLVAKNRKDARALLDIFERAARHHLMWGKFLIVLVQTNDPHYSCEDIGCHNATWNPREWFDADRGL